MSETLGDRIGIIIRKAGIKRVQFAERVGIDQSYVTQLVNGKRNPGNHLLADICREFNVSEAWLRTGEGDMFLEESTDILDRLADAYNLDTFGRKLIGKMVRLDDEQWSQVKRFMEELFEELEMSKPAQPPPETIEEKAARLEQENQALQAHLAETQAALDASLKEEKRLAKTRART